MKVLVTGATGFIGRHLVAHLLARGDAVCALVRDETRARAALPAGSGCAEAAIGDRAALGVVLDRERPDVVYHLAAQSYPGVSWDDPHGTFSANLAGTAALLDAVRAWGKPRVIVAGSSAMYAVSDHPISEDAPTGPASPYGVSKLASDALAGLYAKRYGMDLVRVRPFFIIGRGKTGDVCSDFARRVVEAERAGGGVLKTGRLDIVRDFLDVRDAVRALILLAERGAAGMAYNICRGEGTRLDEVVRLFCGMAAVPLRAEQDAALLRPVEEPVKVGDGTRLRALGWASEWTLEESLTDILAGCREEKAP